MLGLELFSSGLGDLYYASNDMDPYLKNNDVSMLSLAVKETTYSFPFF